MKLAKLDDLRPRSGDKLSRGAWLAALAHVGLIVALALGVSWRAREPEGIEAELWATVPQVAAPRPATPEPAPKPAPAPPPKPQPKVEAAPPPPPPPPPPDRDAEIAREKERQAQQLEQQRQAEEQQKREAERQAEEKRQLEEQQQREEAERKKLEAQKKKAEAERQAKLEAQKKAEAERKAKLEAQKKAEAERKAKLEEQKRNEQIEAMRAEHLKRMQGELGATGAPDSTGTAARTAGPSAGYAGRIKARIRPNIIYTDEPAGNPVASVEVTVAPDGTITGRQLARSSGLPEWDEAVLRAIDKTQKLPLDTDGTVPPKMVIDFRPHDL